jgi:hypothetical protein
MVNFSMRSNEALLRLVRSVLWSACHSLADMFACKHEGPDLSIEQEWRAGRIGHAGSWRAQHDSGALAQMLVLQGRQRCAAAVCGSKAAHALDVCLFNNDRPQ